VCVWWWCGDGNEGIWCRTGGQLWQGMTGVHSWAQGGYRWQRVGGAQGQKRSLLRFAEGIKLIGCPASTKLLFRPPCAQHTRAWHQGFCPASATACPLAPCMPVPPALLCSVTAASCCLSGESGRLLHRLRQSQEQHEGLMAGARHGGVGAWAKGMSRQLAGKPKL